MTMPLRDLIDLYNRLPAVLAQRSLQTAEAISIGVGRYSKADHKSVVDRWRKAARALERRARRRPLTREEKIALLEGPSDVPISVTKVSFG
jgi:hypothetical protein